MSTYEDWVSIFRTSTDYEADLVRDRLDDGGVPAVVLTQRDHAFNLNVGDLAAVHVMVPPDRADEAVELLEQRLDDDELEAAALEADPETPPARPPDEESKLDSGQDQIDMGPPNSSEEDDSEEGS
ncbi:MAG: putative signal transducing protein [Salinibacter sp.]